LNFLGDSDGYFVLRIKGKRYLPNLSAAHA
jgi:hypothetical protein